jgi:hypothetical protein
MITPPKKWIIRILPMALVLAVGVAFFVNRLFREIPSPSFPVPGTNASLQVVLKPTHPYLAEYERTLIVFNGQQSVRTRIFNDTGGYGKLNIYSTGPNSILVRGPFEEVTVHLDSLTIEINSTPSRVPTNYLATFTNSNSSGWHFIPANEQREQEIKASQP